MKHLKKYKIFEIGNYYIDKRASDRKKTEFIGDVKEPVEIRIDVEAIGHALGRQFRHGVSANDSGKIEANITKDEILDAVEASVEQLTIALMQGDFEINQKEDDYPTRGVREGEPNRFVIRNKKTNLNLVCSLKSGDWEFTLTVVTVMKKPDFKEYKGQFVIEI